MIEFEFEVEGISFRNQYDAEIGTESGDVHIEGKTKGTKMTMSKTEARKRHRKAVIHSNESTTPLTSESLLGITPEPSPLE